MAGNPVEDNTHPGLMTPVDKEHKVLRCAEPACRGKITRALIPPGSIEGMLGDGKELYMGITEFLDVRYQFRSNFTICKKAAVGLLLP
ncbi:hypothetical protein BMS3Bbin07_00868 [bacterium BMS3Bbin07]|nr:hypothetical protein BMS3Bbin07_00868 [bacterium BMS3Bbin07]